MVGSSGSKSFVPSSTLIVYLYLPGFEFLNTHVNRCLSASGLHLNSSSPLATTMPSSGKLYVESFANCQTIEKSYCPLGTTIGSWSTTMYPLTTLTLGLCGSGFLTNGLPAQAASTSIDTTTRTADLFMAILPLI